MSEITEQLHQPLPPLENDDDRWALPRPRATLRAKVVAGCLGAVALSLLSFSVGVNVGKGRVPATTGFGAGGFGRNGGFGGLGGSFGGLGGGLGSAGVGSGSAGTPTTVAGASVTTTTVDPNFGGLLPGLDDAPMPPSSPPTSALASSPVSKAR